MIKSSLRRDGFVLLLAVASLLLLSVSAAKAQPKIALVNLKKVFDGFYKAKQAEAQLRERGEEADKQYQGMLDEYQKASGDYKKLVEIANDQAVSSAEREKRKKSAEVKVLEINEIERTLAQFKREKLSTFDEQKKRMREQIVRDIRVVIDNKARAANYTLVLDSSAESLNFAPFILFSSGQNDLTEEVLGQVNVTAPPVALAADSKDKAQRDIKLNIPDLENAKPAQKR
jgi:outer membrane protein